MISLGITDNSLRYHLEIVKKNGVTKDELVGIITHTAFYVGWPKGWVVFNLTKEIIKMSKKLVVYFSYTGNTRKIANIIKDKLKCDILYKNNKLVMNF